MLSQQIRSVISLQFLYTFENNLKQSKPTDTCKSALLKFNFVVSHPKDMSMRQLFLTSKIYVSTDG